MQLKLSDGAQQDKSPFPRKSADFKAEKVIGLESERPLLGQHANGWGGKIVYTV